MVGHMGDKSRTILNLEIIKSDLENDLIYLKGSLRFKKFNGILKSLLKILAEKLLKKI